MASSSNLVGGVMAGASLGIGKGAAIALGQKGATVYVVGRTTISGTQVSAGRIPVPGSIHEATAEVTAAGSHGIPGACDLAKDEEIRALFEQVERESGHVDILVNNAASLHEGMGTRPFWNAPVKLADIIDVGLRDPAMMDMTGETLIAAELAEKYGIADLPDHQPTSLCKFYGAPHHQTDVG
jgi:NAD(P)-dependent dehydrogenase (short-subunit alcohol dehydrogenase family)